MEQDRVVYRFQRNSEEEVRFTLHEYKDRQYLDLRLWFLPADGGEYKPTRKGLTLPLEFLSELKKGVAKTEQEAPKTALQPASNSVK